MDLWALVEGRRRNKDEMDEILGGYYVSQGEVMTLREKSDKRTYINGSMSCCKVDGTTKRQNERCGWVDMCVEKTKTNEA